jgi:hypothetical protein
MKTLIFYLITLAIFYLGSIVGFIWMGISAFQDKEYLEYWQWLSIILMSLFGSIALTVAGVFLFKIIREKMKEIYTLDKSNKELTKEIGILQEEGISLQEKQKRLFEENSRLIKEIYRLIGGN